MRASGLELAGKTLGSYRVLGLLGEGGMGAVWLAEHAVIGRKAAIKVLHPEFALKPDAVQRFFNEARAANRVQHPSIVDIYDYGQAEGVGAYIVMEYLKGESLAARLERRRVLPPRLVASIVAKVASAVGAAHASGLVHRDLKPDNLFLLPDPDHPGEERVKVLDFGVAKLLEDGGPARGLVTGTGQVLGTPRYMSPEQCDGAKAIDARSDVYALGVIAYEMITGRPPFVAEGYGELLVQHITMDPLSPSALRADVPAELEEVVLVALRKRPQDRWQTMDAFADAVLQAVEVLPYYDDDDIEDGDGGDQPPEELDPDAAARNERAEPNAPTVGAGPKARTPVTPVEGIRLAEKTAQGMPRRETGPQDGVKSSRPKSAQSSRPRSAQGSRPRSAQGSRPGSAQGPRPKSGRGSRPGSANEPLPRSAAVARHPSTLSASAVALEPSAGRPKRALVLGAAVALLVVGAVAWVLGAGTRGGGDGAATAAGTAAAAASATAVTGPSASANAAASATAVAASSAPAPVTATAPEPMTTAGAERVTAAASEPVMVAGAVRGAVPDGPTVIVTIESRPAGATVTKEADRSVAGKTPWTGEVASGPGEVAFILMKKGFKTLRVSVPRATGARRIVDLAPAPRTAKPDADTLDLVD